MVAESNAKLEQEQFMKWLKSEARDYMEVFDLSPDYLHGKKILEIGAGDRRFAATCMINNITREVYSLEPALGPKEKSGYMDKEFIDKVVKKIPQNIQLEINKRTVIAEAETMPFKENTFDLILGRSVSYESAETLKERLKELLRAGKEIRLYPIDANNLQIFNSALGEIEKEMRIHYEYKTTVETDLPAEDGIRHVKEDVLILRKTA